MQRRIKNLPGLISRINYQINVTINFVKSKVNFEEDISLMLLHYIKGMPTENDTVAFLRVQCEDCSALWQISKFTLFPLKMSLHKTKAALYPQHFSIHKWRPE